MKTRKREPGRDVKILGDRMLHIKGSAGHSSCWTFQLYRPSRSLAQFRTQGFLRIESTAVQRCARMNTESASGSKLVGENREEMENSLVPQDSTHRGFC